MQKHVINTSASKVKYIADYIMTNCTIIHTAAVAMVIEINVHVQSNSNIGQN